MRIFDRIEQLRKMAAETRSDHAESSKNVKEDPTAVLAGTLVVDSSDPDGEAYQKYFNKIPDEVLEEMYRASIDTGTNEPYIDIETQQVPGKTENGRPVRRTIDSFAPSEILNLSEQTLNQVIPRLRPDQIDQDVAKKIGVERLSADQLGGLPSSYIVAHFNEIQPDRIARLLTFRTDLISQIAGNKDQYAALFGFNEVHNAINKLNPIILKRMDPNTLGVIAPSLSDSQLLSLDSSIVDQEAFKKNLTPQQVAVLENRAKAEAAKIAAEEEATKKKEADKQQQEAISTQGTEVGNVFFGTDKGKFVGSTESVLQPTSNVEGIHLFNYEAYGKQILDSDAFKRLPISSRNNLGGLIKQNIESLKTEADLDARRIKTAEAQKAEKSWEITKMNLKKYMRWGRYFITGIGVGAFAGAVLGPFGAVASLAGITAGSVGVPLGSFLNRRIGFGRSNYLKDQTKLAVAEQAEEEAKRDITNVKKERIIRDAKGQMELVRQQAQVLAIALNLPEDQVIKELFKKTHVQAIYEAGRNMAKMSV